MYEWKELHIDQKYEVITHYVTVEDDINSVQETMIENLMEGCVQGDLTRQAYPLPLTEIINWWDKLLGDEARKDILGIE